MEFLKPGALEFPAWSRGSRTIKKIILCIVLLAMAAACYHWREELRAFLPGGDYRPRPTATRKKPLIKVITRAVEIQANDLVFEGVGTGLARLSAELHPAVSEEVVKVLFKAGDRVARGQVLVELDRREEQLALRLAEVKLADAKSLLGRYEQAVKQGGVPQSEVDSARAAFEAAKVALDQARLDLEERLIKAPFAGVVGIPSVDPGDRVGPGTLLTGLDDRRVLFVDFEIPEALAGALQGDKEHQVQATTPAFPGRSFTGRIRALASRVDPRRRTLLVRAHIDNREDLLRPGMSFTTRWEISGKAHPSVPEISLQWGREGSFVWIIRAGIARKVPVRVVARTAGRVLIEGKLEQGEQVVVEGLQRLRPDLQVHVLGRQEAAR